MVTPEDANGVTRFSVSLPESLLRDFDAMAREKGYDNRSLAVADLIRASLVEHQENENAQVVGTVTLVYDHHKRHLPSLLTDLQHDHTDIIVSTLHVHLDHDNCLEVLVVRGAMAQVKHLANALIAAKGVKHGRLSVTGAGTNLPV